MISLGSGNYVFKDDIILIFDSDLIDEEENKEIIQIFRNELKVIDTCDRDKIRSYLYCEKDGENIFYTSSFRTKTLNERFEEELEVIDDR